MLSTFWVVVLVFVAFCLGICVGGWNLASKKESPPFPTITKLECLESMCCCVDTSLTQKRS